MLLKRSEKSTVKKTNTEIFHIKKKKWTVVTLKTIESNQNHISSLGFTICTVNNILCPLILDLSEEKLAMKMEKNENF